MARSDDGRRRTWRFKLDEGTILEVSAPMGATEKQIRRRGRVSLVLGTLVAAMALVAVAYADQVQADSDVVAAAIQNAPIVVNLGPGGATNVTAGVQIRDQGSTHVTFPVSIGVTTSNTTGSTLGAPATTPVSVAAYGNAGEATTTVPVTAPGAADLVCGENNPFGGKITFTAAPQTGFSGGNNTDFVTVNVNVAGPPCAPANAPPTVDAGGSYLGAEGSAVGVDGTVTDPDGDAFTTQWSYAVDSADAGTTCSFGDAGAVDTTVTCTDDGSFTLTLTADDGANAPVSDTASLTLTNANPAITSASFGTGSPPHVSCGTNNASLTVAFTDAGANDTHEADVDWDGATTPVYDQNVDPFTSGGSVSHTYSGGSHTAKVKVTDDNGGTSNVASATVVVDYNTSGILQPVNDTRNGQQPSMFKYKSTIPVKIRITDCDGSAVSTLTPTVSFKKISGESPTEGADEAASTVPPTDGNTMRWDDVAQQYVYNLATKQLGTDSSATYRITVTVQAGQTVSADIGVKP